MKVKLARMSVGIFNETHFQCTNPWPEDCFCQCGGNGLVFENISMEEVFAEPSKAIDLRASIENQQPEAPKDVQVRRTAFFEAFPQNPKTFLRGEGKTVGEAEEDCWKRYQKILNCDGHEFERRNRTDGYCFCRHCGLSGTFMEPTTNCRKCGRPAAYGTDKHGNWYCEDHCNQMPREDWPEWRVAMDQD